jgi:hypothetical protein
VTDDDSTAVIFFAAIGVTVSDGVHVLCKALVLPIARTIWLGLDPYLARKHNLTQQSQSGWCEFCCAHGPEIHPGVSDLFNLAARKEIDDRCAVPLSVVVEGGMQAPVPSGSGMTQNCPVKREAGGC